MSEKRFVPNKRVWELARKAAHDPRLSPEQRRQAAERLADAAKLQSADHRASEPARTSAALFTRPLLMVVLYGVAAPILFASMALIIPPILVLIDTAWAWIVHDKIEAILMFERQAMRIDSTLERILGGTFVGVPVSIFLLGKRWLSGKWPHE